MGPMGPIGPIGPIEAAAWPAVVEQVVLESKYAGYIGRQAEQVERFKKLESNAIPPAFDYDAIPQLRHEAKEKLSRIRPGTLGQAGRISGISPARSSRRRTPTTAS